MEQEIQDNLARMEDALSKVAQIGRDTADMMDKWADANKVSQFKRAVGMGSMHQAVGHIGNAQLSVHVAHEEAQKFDPRPQPRDGGGK